MKANNEFSEISIYSIFHDAAYTAFISVYDNLDFFKVIKPFFVNGGEHTIFPTLVAPQGFIETHNDRCSELSAIHYIWRNNLFSDIVGICHYRRYLLLSPINQVILGQDEFQIHIPAKEFKGLTLNVEDSELIQWHKVVACHDEGFRK